MKKLCFAIMVLLVLASSAEAIVIGGISLTDLGPGVTPNAVNNAGQVVGQDASGQAFLWQAGTVTPLGTLGGTQSAANDINDNGVVIGWANLGTGLQHGFKWASGGSMVDLTPGAAYESTAEAVNISTEVVGWIRSGSMTRSALWLANGTLIPLFGNINSEALGINDGEQVVGVRLDASGQPNLGYYWNGINTSYWTTGYGDYYPLGGINDTEVTVGRHLSGAAYLTIGELGQHDIGDLDIHDLLSECRGLNDQSLLVGFSGDKAFLFDLPDHHLYNLNNFLPTGSTFSQLTVANDINNSGMFVGVGLVGAVQHGFVGQITITPEPSTLALLAFGVLAAIGMAVLRFFRRRGLLPKKTAAASLLLAFLCLSSTAHAVQIGSITLTDLGAGVVPNAINNVGQVVGQDASGQAFLWQSGAVTPLGTLGGAQSAANDINDSGVIVGWADDGTGKQKAFKWNGTMTSIDSGSTTASAAEAINSAGDVVGWRLGTSYQSMAWYHFGGSLPLFGSANSQALGINANREVVGVTRTSLGQIYDGYYWDGTGGGSNWTNDFLSYHPLAGINNSSLSAGEDIGLAGYWKVGEGVNGIAKLDPVDLSALVCGLNDQSLLAGYSGNKAFLFDLSDQSLFNLSTYLPPASLFTQLNVANDINNSGMFVGVGLVGSVQHGFVGQVNTVPEPSAIAMLAIAVAGLFSFRFLGRGAPR